MKRSTLWLAGILVAAAAIRIVWLAFTTRHPLPGPGIVLPDPRWYFVSANDIATGHGYQLNYPTARLPPGYPYALASVFWIVRHTPIPDDLPTAGVALNFVVSLASVALVYVIGNRLFSSVVGLVGAGLMAIFPGPIYYVSSFLSESLFIFLTLAALAVVVTADWRDGRLPTGRLCAFGALVGAAALTRPPGLVMLLALAITAWVAGAGVRGALVQTGVALALAVVVIAPWTVRNMVTMHDFVPISTNGGVDLCIGHNPIASGAYLESPDCVRPLDVAPERLEVAREHDNTKEALTFITHHPDREPGLLVKKVRYLWDSDHEGLVSTESYGYDAFIRSDVRRTLEVVANVFFFTVSLLGLFGLLGFVGRDPRRVLVLATLVAFVLTPLVFFGNPRFHEPALPLLSVSAAVALTWLARHVRKPVPAPQA